MGLRSPSYGKFIEHNALIVPIEEIGWEFAIHFGGIADEVKMIRERAGFVDYSFQNEIAVVGKDAFRFLQKVLVNDLNKIKPGRAIYSSLLDDDGNFIDDATVFWMEENYFQFNGGAVKDHVNQWLHKHAAAFDVTLVHTGLCLLSVQGPKSREILKDHIDIADLSYYDVKRATINGMPVIVGRLGYSGELGYELFFLPEYVSNMWDYLLAIGKEYGLGPYGIGATGVLAIEKGLLTPFDYYPGSSPLELGLGWTVAFNKGDFLGKEALLKRKKEGIKTRLVAFEIKDPDFELDHHAPVFKNGAQVGEVTEFAPGLTVGKALLARAFVNIDVAREGETIEVKHNGKTASATVTLQKDWYDPGSKKVRI
jgi:aminomethyltransferase